MRNIKIALLLSLVFVTVFALGITRHKGGKNAVPFKVIELFTSEGCSSCPSADEVVKKISQEFQGKDVFILAYHVDYWDKLGWKDPFSSSAYSAIQYRYGEHFNLSSIYTPQLVINGSVQFVGSDERRLRNELGKQISTVKLPDLTIDEVTLDKKIAKVVFSVTNANQNDKIRISLIQKFATSSVIRGENKGRTLSHVQVVRDQKSTTVGDLVKSVSLILPQEFDPSNFELIGFIQEQGTGKIIGATRKNF